VGVETAEGNAAGGIDEGAIPGDTGAAANRPLNIGSRLSSYSRAVREERRGGVPQAGAIDRTFEANHKLVELVVIPDMAAADHTARIAAEGCCDKGICREEGIIPGEVVVAAGPGVANLTANINAGPCEDRRRRQIDRRRSARGKIGRQRRRS